VCAVPKDFVGGTNHAATFGKENIPHSATSSRKVASVNQKNGEALLVDCLHLQVWAYGIEVKSPYFFVLRF